jgi:hypothetical protein
MLDYGGRQEVAQGDKPTSLVYNAIDLGCKKVFVGLPTGDFYSGFSFLSN